MTDSIICNRLVSPQPIDLEVVSVLRTLVRREIIIVYRASMAVVELARLRVWHSSV